MNPTARIYKNIETGEYFRLYHDPETDKYDLRHDETEEIVKHFYLCMRISTEIKINNWKKITLTEQTFYALKNKEVITHSRYPQLNQKFKATHNGTI